MAAPYVGPAWGNLDDDPTYAAYRKAAFAFLRARRLADPDTPTYLAAMRATEDVWFESRSKAPIRRPAPKPMPPPARPEPKPKAPEGPLRLL